MKMPATTNTKVEAKPSTDLGDAAKQCLNCLEKKVRNLEKRKGKIEINREKAEKGTKLEKEQEISLNQYEQVTHDLEFARELHKQFQTIHSEHEKMVKKQAKREKAERQSMEIKRVSEILQLQSTLDLLGGDKVREDFKTGKHGAVVLTEDNLDQLDQLYQAISPSRDDSGDDYPKKLTAAAEHLVNILDGKDRQVLGTTYKELKDLLTLINECGYFETAKLSGSDEGEAVESEEAVEAVEEEEDQDPVTDTLSQGAASDDQDDETCNNSAQPVAVTQQQQPIDLTTSAQPVATDGVKSHLDMPTQPMNTLEQDAFFAPSSTAYQTEASAHFSQQQQQQQNPSQVPDFQSFTNNRPFQFIQASYIMSEQQTAPSVVDPAVLHAQPAGTGGLQFMSAATAYDNSPPTHNSAPPSQPASQSQPNGSSNATVAGSQPPAAPAQGTPQDFVASQTFGQSALQQAEGLFPVGQPVEDTPLGLMGQMRAEDPSNSSPYEIPPSIPMPPSQAQDQSQLEQQHQQHQQQLEEKKFQMNASAPVFQSMYAQVATGTVPVSVPPPTMGSDSQGPPSAAGDFNSQSANSDFQQGYQGASDFNYSRSGGNRGNYRGSRNGGPPSGARNGGGNNMQNGFGRTGGPSTNNGRGGRGGYGYSGPYRQDYQNTFNAGGFGGYQKRGGMNNTGGPPNVGNAGYNSRGGMRGGMPRGGGQRGGNMRGGGAGFSRPPPNQ